MDGTKAQPIAIEAGATPDLPKAQQRVESLDLIRGIAVMGIVIANMSGFGALHLEHQWPSVDGPLTGGEKIAWLLQYMFVDGKLRGLFSLLFGVGMVIFLERAKARGAPAMWLQLRRLFWLLLFGLFHYFVLFPGDILHNYAVAGLVVLLFLWVPPKWLFGVAAFLFVANTYMPATSLLGYRDFENAALAAPEDSELRHEYADEIAKEVADARAEGEVVATGSLPEIVEMRVRTLSAPLVNHPERWLSEYALLMLMGAGLYRMGFFSGAFSRRKMLWWGIAGIAVSAAASLPLGLWTMREGFPRALNLFVFYGPVYAIRLPMILGFAAVLVATSQAILQSGIGERIAAAGRMAFSNYLGTSLLMALIFQGWGLGLFNQFDKVERLALVLLAWAIILLWSKPWLARFRFGPLEWLWRCLTYWQIFPIRRTA